MIWIVGLGVALVTTLFRAIEGDTLRHWSSFHLRWAIAGVIASWGVLTAVGSLGVFAFSQLPSTGNASGVERGFGAAVAALVALSAVRRYPHDAEQKVISIGDTSYTLPKGLEGSPSTLALGYLPEVIRFVDGYVQRAIRRWADSLSLDDLMSALVYLDYRGTPMFPTKGQCLAWRERQRLAIESGGESGRDARVECIENVVFRYSAYRVDR